MVQSSLSASLLGLGRELGTQLFTRGARRAELTEAGRAFLGHARSVIAEPEQARNAVAAVEGLIRGSVRVATVALPRGIDLAETISWFRDEHPGVSVHVLPSSARQAASLVTDGQVDFVVAPLSPGARPGLRFDSLASTPLGVHRPRDVHRHRHRHAGRRPALGAGGRDEGRRPARTRRPGVPHGLSPAVPTPVGNLVVRQPHLSDPRRRFCAPWGSPDNLPNRTLCSRRDRRWPRNCGDDARLRPPTPAVGRDAARGGLGLYLVARVTGAHGWIDDGPRKTTWARIDYTRAEAPPGEQHGVPRPRGGRRTPAPER